MAARFDAPCVCGGSTFLERPSAQSVRRECGLSAGASHSGVRTPLGPGDRGVVTDLISRRAPDRISQRQPGVAHERRRDPADRADAGRPGVVSLFVPRGGLDANLSALDDALEQVLQAVCCAPPGVALRKKAPAPSHLHRELWIVQ